MIELLQPLKPVSPLAFRSICTNETLQSLNISLRVLVNLLNSTAGIVSLIACSFLKAVSLQIFWNSFKLLSFNSVLFRFNVF